MLPFLSIAATQYSRVYEDHDAIHQMDSQLHIAYEERQSLLSRLPRNFRSSPPYSIADERAAHLLWIEGQSEEELKAYSTRHHIRYDVVQITDTMRCPHAMH